MAVRTLTRIFHYDDLYPSIPIKIIPPIRIMESPIGLSINIKDNNSTIVYTPHSKDECQRHYYNPSQVLILASPQAILQPLLSKSQYTKHGTPFLDTNDFPFVPSGLSY
jgi:hypothetical protein